jgi:hypothetical protein
MIIIYMVLVESIFMLIMIMYFVSYVSTVIYQLVNGYILLGSIHIHADAFVGACSYCHLSVAQWLYELGGVNIHAVNDYAFCRICAN